MNPWAMVIVQLKYVGKHGAHIVPEMVVEIEATNDDVVVTMDGGKHISTLQVLLYTNAYRNMFFSRKELSYKHILFLLCLLKLERNKWIA